MICSFGRFIRADDTSKNMTDLRAYRCRIAVDDIQEIPQRLAIVMGDEVVDIFVHVESSELVREAGDQLPPPPPPPIAPVIAPGEGEGRPREDVRRLAGMEGGGEGGGAADALDLDGHSDISVIRAPGSSSGDDVFRCRSLEGPRRRSRRRAVRRGRWWVTLVTVVVSVSATQGIVRVPSMAGARPEGAGGATPARPAAELPRGGVFEGATYGLWWRCIGRSVPWRCGGPLGWGGPPVVIPRG